MAKSYARLICAAFLCLVLASGTWATQTAPVSNPYQDAVAAAIAENADVFPAGAAVVSVTVTAGTAVVDLNGLSVPDGDAQADDMLVVIAGALGDWPEITAVEVSVSGKAIGDLIAGSSAPDTSTSSTTTTTIVSGVPLTVSMAAVPAIGGLDGKKVALHPSHGSYWHQRYGRWFRAQRTLCGPNPWSKPPGWSGSWYTPSDYYYYTRGYQWGSFYEDDMSPETIRFLKAYLINDGASAFVSRELNKSAGNFDYSYYGYPNCSFPLPMWQVAAKYYLQTRGDVPEWVWNEKKLYYDSDKDIRARPYYANYVGADLSFSLHSNAVGGCPSGTGSETYWYTAQYEKKIPGLRDNAIRFAGCMNNGVVNAIRNYFEDYGRAAYGPLFTEKGPRPPDWTRWWNYDQYTGWRNRGVKTANFGEIREAKMPAALCEIAFHDAWQFWPDNLFLQDQIWRSTAAWGFYEGICNYFGTTPKPRLDASVAWVTFPKVARPGQTISGTVTMQNLGQAWCWGNKWVDRLYFPYTVWDLAATAGDQFAPGTKILLPADAVVAPRKTVNFDIALTAPAAEGIYATSWQMLKDDSKGGAFGQIASAQIKVDSVSPLVSIASPSAGSYTRLQAITLAFGAEDDTSIASLNATYDGSPVASGTSVDLFWAGLGTHTLDVVAVDDLGNQTADSRSFAVIATLDSLVATVDKLFAMGQIDNEGIASSLYAKAAKYQLDDGNTMAAENYLKEFRNQVSAQSGHHITVAAANLLLGDAAYVEAHLAD